MTVTYLLWTRRWHSRLDLESFWFCDPFQNQCDGVPIVLNADTYTGTTDVLTYKLYICTILYHIHIAATDLIENRYGNNSRLNYCIAQIIYTACAKTNSASWTLTIYDLITFRFGVWFVNVFFFFETILMADFYAFHNVQRSPPFYILLLLLLLPYVPYETLK